MNRLIPFKDHLSIQQLGRLNFGIGLLVGLFSFLVTSSFLIYGREMYRLLASDTVDLRLQFHKEWMIDIFLISIAYNHALGITLWFWFSNLGVQFKSKRKRHINLNKIYNITLPLIVIWLLIRFFSLILSFQGTTIQEIDTSFLKEYSILICFLPLALFFINWNHYKNIFHCRSWIFSSFIIGVFAILTMSLTFDIQQKKINHRTQKFYLPQLEYINQEIEKAQQHSVLFQEETLQALKELRSLNSSLQTEAVKKVFYKNRIVSIDSLILEKIIVHNRKDIALYSSYKDRIHLSYVPIEMVLNQIQLRQQAHDLNHFEKQILIDLFHELATMVDSTQEEDMVWEILEEEATVEEEKREPYFYCYKKAGASDATITKQLRMELETILQQ